MLSAFLAGLAVATAAFTASLASVTWARRSDPYAVTSPTRTPYLGGHAPQTHAWSRFHVRYYPMTLLFIAFEMEMMFMYPWAVVYVEEGAKALIEMGMFLSILSVGIVYAHREGAFRWQ